MMRKQWVPQRPANCPTPPQDMCLAGGHKEAEEFVTECESQTSSNPLSHVFQQVTHEGNFGQAQKQDEYLKNYWGQVSFIKEEDQLTGQLLPKTYFLVCQGLLFHHTEHHGQDIDLLVVPCAKVDIVMHLAHFHPLGGSPFQARVCWKKISDHFLWPGMNTEIKNFCQHCPQYQHTTPNTCFSLLVPLPIIGVPFERVGMDMVGLLPKPAQGHEYILVIMDYTTQ